MPPEEEAGGCGLRVLVALKDMAETKAKPEKKKRGGDSARPRQRVNPLMRYFRETRGEMRKVTWPTREESWRLTTIVLGATVAFALFMGALDFAFSRAFRLLVDLIA